MRAARVVRPRANDAIRAGSRSFALMLKRSLPCRSGAAALYVAAVACLVGEPLAAQSSGAARYPINDAHFHLTNYVQRGGDIHELLEIMGDSVGRVALFGIPLQQLWSYSVTGEAAPTYYLQSDAPLYYYSFTDAYIAAQYLSLPRDAQRRFDPMITGFNPADMYAAEHIRRVLQTFPGVFTGIGEFTIHKEFVSDKVQPGPASLLNPALDSVLSTAGAIGLVVILHNDMDVPFPSDTARPAYLDQVKAIIRRHPETTIIWAHTGVGRVVRPVKNHTAVLDAMLSDPSLANLYFDISWDEVAKYVVSSPETVRAVADLINRHPTRFLYGSDVVAPADRAAHLGVFHRYEPLWAALSPEASANVRFRTYERLFDIARKRVRAWEAAHTRVANHGQTSTR
jgi:predicted TIM-barrel fold metal-dependent hydrolase